VLDDYGDAAEDVKVRLWSAQFSGGQPLFAVQSGASSTVDDQGRYRLPVAPGKYFVEVIRNESPTPIDPLTRPLYIRTSGQASMPLGYYPAAARVDQAADVYVGPNQQVSGVNVTLHRPGPPIRISGTVVDADGKPLQGTVSVIPIVGPSGSILSQRMTSSNPDGTFEFMNLSAGDYILRASREGDLGLRGRRGLGATEFGWQRISVSESASGPFRIQAPRTAHILGRIALESSRDIRSLSPSEFQFAAMSVDPVTAPDSTMAVNTPLQGLAIVEIANDWTFDQHGFAAPSRLTLNHGPRGWWLKSVHAPTPQPAYEPIEPGGALGGNVEVTLVVSDTAATLSGRVLDAQRRPQTQCIVVVFAIDQRRWFSGSPYVRLMMPQEKSSRFTIDSIPPGEYFVAAMEGRLWNVVQDPEVLLSLSTTAQRVRLAERDVVTTDVRLTAAP